MKDATSTKTIRIEPLARITPTAVSWLWPARIPRGKLSVMAGDPGLGKSYLSLRMAATVSTGAMWPDGGRATRGTVLILSAEDDAADTIRPRLDGMGADVARIFMVDTVQDADSELGRFFSLRQDVDVLREAIEDAGADLVLIDPLNAYLAGVDSHKAAEVRGALSPLAAVAADTGAAVVCVHHLNKGSSANALYRASGSLDFIAAARVVHGVAADPDDPERRLFVPLKCNLSTMPAGIGFRVDDSGVVFDHDPVTIGAAEAFANRQADSDDRTERDDAKEFLLGELAAGSVLATDVFASARALSITEKTLRRAAADLNVAKTKTNYRGPWEWSLPKMATTADVDQVAILGTLGESEPENGGVQAPKMATEPQDAHPIDVAILGTLGDSAPVPVDLFDRAAAVVTSTGAASVSLIAKRCKCSVGEADEVMKALEVAGIVGPANGKARAVLMDDYAGQLC
jgi:putative DNA primase/helicase